MIKQLITTLLIIASFTAGVVYAENITCTKVGEWGTDRYADVFIQGSYAYCAAEEAGLDIIDVGNPSSPKKIGGIDALYARRVWVNANTRLAYLADTSELKIIDISVPSAPKSMGVYDPNLLVEDVVVNGNYAFIIGSIFSSDFFGNGELHILDISNPAAPIFLGMYKTDVISSVYISNNYAYLTAYYYDEFEIMHSHFDIVDISDYSSPQRIGTAALDESDIKGISMKGNYVYLGGSKLHTIDVSDPSSPSLVGNTAVTGSIINDIYVKDNYAYAAAGDGGLDIFNISAPAAPGLVKNCPTPGSAHGVYVQGNYAYMADMDKGLQVIDISHPASAYIAGTYGGSIAIKSMNISGTHAYLGTSSDGLLILNISDKTSPTPVGKYQLPYPHYYVNDAHIKGNYAYLLDGGYLGNRGFKVLNISDPSSPTLLGTIDSLYSEHIFVNGNYAYAIGDSTGLTVIDISTVGHPEVKGSLSLGEATYGIFVSGNYAYITGERRLMVIDISNPASPVLTGSLSINGYHNLFVQGNYAYVVGNKFYVIDISQPGSPVVVGKCDDLGYQATVNGNHAFIAASFLGLKVIDISEPAAPFLSGTYSTPGSARFIEGDEDYVYLGDNGSGQFFIFKLSPSSHMVLDKTELYFSASTSGFKTGAQNLLIDKIGENTLNWQAASTQPWLSCSPAFGRNAGVISVSVNAGGLAPGTYTGSITVSDPAADNSPQTAAVTLKVYDPPLLSGPFGDFATPIAGSIVQSSIPVTGWALDDIAVERVDIYREEGAGMVYIGKAVFIEGARPDVGTAYPGYPLNYKAGWGYMMLTNLLPGGGNGTFTLHAIATDVEGNQVTLGTKTVICDNEHAVKPFGAIDTPTQGDAASGGNFINWGWVLTAPPNMVPTDGSTIDVWVDGLNLGHPTYNNNRPDIAALFPGYLNSDGAGGYFHFNTTAYKNGVHTIAWSADDNAGNADGIGSRYFSIQNTGADTGGKGSEEARKSGRAEKDKLGRGSAAFSPCSPVVDRYSPVYVSKGYDREAEPQQAYPDRNGNIRVEIKELERVAIRLNDEQAVEMAVVEYLGYLAVGDRLQPLPIGSTMDIERGFFYWQPGPGFVGNYRLVFFLKGQNGALWKKNILININPGSR
ncbi:MAG: hypothetical protein NT166_28795 [Candidatus Aminicenantes bacterium]|nr:hypothetical protein [Candidatus Aminicenantes bacterium]